MALQLPFCSNQLDLQNKTLRQLLMTDPLDPSAIAVVCITKFGEDGMPISKIDIPYTTELLLRLNSDPNMITEQVMPVIQRGLQECAITHGMSDQQKEQWLNGQMIMGHEIQGIQDVMSGQGEFAATASSGAHYAGVSTTTPTQGNTQQAEIEESSNPQRDVSLQQDAGNVQPPGEGGNLPDFQSSDGQDHASQGMQGQNPLQGSTPSLGAVGAPIRRPASM